MKLTYLKNVKTIFIIVNLFSIAAFAQHTHVTNLRVEHLNNPLGIETTTPRLSWQMVSNQRGQKQRSYQILCAQSLEKLNQNMGDYWDSGKINDSNSINIPYMGAALKPRAKVFWKVRVWGIDGELTSWSNTAFFTIGLLNDSEWEANWIGFESKMSNDTLTPLVPMINARYLRKEFSVTTKVKSAMLYISGLGLYEAYVNGEKVGESVLAPAQSDFSKIIYYNTYDVSALLKKGPNVLGCILGNGRYVNMRNKLEHAELEQGEKYPKMISQLEVTFEDGTSATIASDLSWKITADGPIRYNNEYDGEIYHAGKELGNWTTAGYKATEWINVQKVESPGGKLTPQMAYPIKVNEVKSPISIIKTTEGSYIADMGQNMAGWIRLPFKAQKGDTVKILYAETLDSNGKLFRKNLRTAKATDVYIAAEDKMVIYEPKFTIHGFRYIEIKGLKDSAGISQIKGNVVYDALETKSTFHCSNKVLNQIYKNAYWTIRSNYRSFPTDCPQRDERQGWLGDRGTSSKGEAMVFDNFLFYKKWLKDIRYAQNEQGVVPGVAPPYYKVYTDDVPWPSTYIVLANSLYQVYGDKSILEDNYEAMAKWSRHMITFLDSGLINKDEFGDWCVPPENPKVTNSESKYFRTSPTLLASCYFYKDLMLVASYARILNKQSDQQYFLSVAENMKEAMNKFLLDKSTFRYESNTMTSNILPLAFDIVPNNMKDKVFNNMLSKFIQEHNTHVGSGVLGVQWQLKTFCKYGRPDLAYRLATHTDYPSWGYMIQKNATTIWELWNADMASPEMNSGNHVMLLGDFIPWLYENIAGISSDTSAPGYKKIIFKPDLISGLDSAHATINSVHGAVSCSWKIDQGKYYIDVKIPANTSATIHIPSVSINDIFESGKVLEDNPYMKVLNRQDGRTVVNLSSGKYSFVSNQFEFPKIEEPIFSPVLYPRDTVVADPTCQIKMWSKNSNAKIVYTTDGSIPNNGSKVFSNPFTVSSSGVIMAKTIAENGIQSTPVRTNIIFYNQSVNGWNYQYYELENPTQIPDFSPLKPIKSGKTSVIDIRKIRNRYQNIGIVFKSFVKIDKEGYYTFYLTSDDGSALYLNNKFIFSNDFRHGITTKRHKLYLKSGIYEAEIRYYASEWGQYLIWDYQFENGHKSEFPLSNIFFSKPTK